MARRTQTYAIRLAVEGGGQVKAELISVGQSGEQSLKRIESAGERASGGLKGLGRQAELLRTGIRTLGGALAGVATVGGLAALVDRSISAANAIGKTADTIGVGVEALQELRFAAKASGVEQQTLDMALQRFTRRAAEAAQGTGEAKDALAQMGIALRDQSGNLRSSEDLLADVADAFARIEDPAERVRLAFKLFDSEGVALVNLLRGGSGALEEMRERARDLGIVLDEHLVRDAERARTELDTLCPGDLGQPHPGGARGGAGDRRSLELARRCRRQGRHRLGAPVRCARGEEPPDAALRARSGQLDDREARGADPGAARVADARLHDLPRHGADQRAGDKLDELRRARDQTQARIAFLEGPPDTGAPAPALSARSRRHRGRAGPGQEPGADRARARGHALQHHARGQRADHRRARAADRRDRGAAGQDGSNAQQVDQLIAQSAAVREAQLSQLRAKEVEAAEKVRAANERVVASLEAERAALTQTERERFVAQALSRLSAEATAQQRREVEQLAGALFDEQQALQARQRLMDEGRSVIDRTRTATEQHAAEIAKLNELLAAGAIDQATYARAVEDANDRALRSSQAWTDGATRFLKDYVAESNDAAAATERAFANAFGGAEDALVGFITSGKLEFQSLADSILADLARMTVRQTITAPLAGALQSAFAGGGSFGLFHEGGVVGERAARDPLCRCRGVRARAALPRRRLRRLRPPAGRGPDHRPARGAGRAARAGRARGEVGTRAAADHRGGQRHRR